MNSVKIERLGLLGKLKANLQQHIKDYDEAMDGYQKKTIESIEKELEKMRQNRNYFPSLGLIKPENHQKDYEQVILMLEMSVDNVIEIQNEDFSHYVMDNWRWKHNFETTMNLYKSK